jgi:hypothetical protein
MIAPTQQAKVDNDFSTNYGSGNPGPLCEGITMGLSPESRASVPGCPLGSGDSKWTEFSAERMG